jgi:hypothetical protein
MPHRSPSNEDLAQTVASVCSLECAVFQFSHIVLICLSRLIPTATETFVQERMTARHANPPLLIPPLRELGVSVPGI